MTKATTKADEKELSNLDVLVDWLIENKPAVKRISVTKAQYKILNGRPYRGFEIYIPGEK
ncbi:MAG: hypothetical protein ABUJ92_00190 [Desulfobacterales bacterium]